MRVRCSRGRRMGGIRLRTRWCRCRGLGSGGFLSDVSMGGTVFLRFLMGILGWDGRDLRRLWRRRRWGRRGRRFACRRGGLAGSFCHRRRRWSRRLILRVRWGRRGRWLGNRCLWIEWFAFLMLQSWLVAEC